MRSNSGVSFFWIYQVNFSYRNNPCYCKGSYVFFEENQNVMYGNCINIYICCEEEKLKIGSLRQVVFLI